MTGYVYTSAFGVRVPMGTIQKSKRPKYLCVLPFKLSYLRTRNERLDKETFKNESKNSFVYSIFIKDSLKTLH